MKSMVETEGARREAFEDFVNLGVEELFPKPLERVGPFDSACAKTLRIQRGESKSSC